MTDLKAWRKEMGLTQVQAAKYLGIAYRTLKRMDNRELTKSERYLLHYLWECKVYSSKPRLWKAKK